MTKTALLAVLLVPLISIGQINTGSLKLADSITLTWSIKDFETKEHKISYCNDGDQKYLCKIDGKEWHGSDRSEATPKNQLTKLTIKIGKQSYNLVTSKMFNPNYSGQLYRHQFKIKKFDKYYRLYSFFSDGGGAYTVYWKIFNSTAVRELISTDDKNFSWQLEK